MNEVLPRGILHCAGRKEVIGVHTYSECMVLTGAVANTPESKAQEGAKHYGSLPHIFTIFPISFIQFYVLN